MKLLEKKKKESHENKKMKSGFSLGSTVHISGTRVHLLCIFFFLLKESHTRIYIFF